MAKDETIYVVQEGESLWDIANAHGMTTLELAKLNNIATYTTIVPGQELKVLSFLYEVKDGDTIYTVSKFFGLTPRRITGLNGLGDPETVTLSKGQFLKIG